MSALTGSSVFLKMECYQPTHAFKIRGIGLLCQEHHRAGKTHLVSSSGGNAGYAVSYAGKKLGMKVTVFVPTTTHRVFVNAIESLGAAVRVEGNVWDETNEIAQQFVAKIKGGFVPPFDHPTLWKGHSTLIDETVLQIQKPEAIVVAVGGGGLACGILQGLNRHQWNDVPLLCVQTEGVPSLKASIEAKHVVTLPKVHTVATSLGAKHICQELFNWTQKHKIIPLLVSDKSAVQACRYFADDQLVLVEPACGAALSVIYDQRSELRSFSSLLVIVCGGIGMSLNLLDTYLNQLT